MVLVAMQERKMPAAIHIVYSGGLTRSRRNNLGSPSRKATSRSQQTEKKQRGQLISPVLEITPVCTQSLSLPSPTAASSVRFTMPSDPRQFITAVRLRYAVPILRQGDDAVLIGVLTDEAPKAQRGNYSR